MAQNPYPAPGHLFSAFNEQNLENSYKDQIQRRAKCVLFTYRVSILLEKKEHTKGATLQTASVVHHEAKVRASIPKELKLINLEFNMPHLLKN